MQIVLKFLEVKGITKYIIFDKCFTIFPVEHNLQFELGFLLQRQFDLPSMLLGRVGTVEEAARAALLHDLSARKAGEVAEAVRTVDDGERR